MASAELLKAMGKVATENWRAVKMENNVNAIGPVSTKSVFLKIEAKVLLDLNVLCSRIIDSSLYETCTLVVLESCQF